MKEILNHLFEHKTLSKTEATEVLTRIARGEYEAAQIAAFLTVFMMRSITVEELEGFRDAMLDLCIPAELTEYDPIDLCGTGGDGKNTFNISTLSSFVVAASGVAVAKHGNHGVSSISGSSTVLEYFGAEFSNSPDVLKKQMDTAGICFLHAPLFHPAMKTVGPIRKQLKVKTFFNMLGPMVNPAFPKKQLVGVFSLELARLYNYLYQKTNKRFCILHTLDGYDEISLTQAFKLYTRGEEKLVEPEEIHLPRLAAESLFGGGTVAESAQIFEDILRGQGSPAQVAVVVANAGTALYCAGKFESWDDCLALARESLESGRALDTFQKFLGKN